METLKELLEKLIVSLCLWLSEHLVKYRIEKALTLTSRGLHHR